MKILRIISLVMNGILIIIGSSVLYYQILQLRNVQFDSQITDIYIFQIGLTLVSIGFVTLNIQVFKFIECKKIKVKKKKDTIKALDEISQLISS